MKQINLTLPGGFPLTQDALKFMQESYNQVLDMLKVSYEVPISGNYIIAGLLPTGPANDYGAGWVSMGNEVIFVAAGVGTHIEKQTTTTSVVYFDAVSRPAYTFKVGNINVGTGSLISSFGKRLEDKLINQPAVPVAAFAAGFRRNITNGSNITFYKNTHNHLRFVAGSVQCTAPSSNNALIFTLPVGHRPYAGSFHLNTPLLFCCPVVNPNVSNTTPRVINIAIHFNGEVRIQEGTLGIDDYFEMRAVSFDCN